MSAAVEDIPDTDSIHRLIDFPVMYEDSQGLLWGVVFQFSKPAFSESVVWNRYAPMPDAIHALGVKREAQKRDTKPEMRYLGFITATVGKVRELRTTAGHGFFVRHEPSEGQHHAEILYRPATGVEVEQMKKGEKNELKLALRGLFGSLVPYNCG